MAFIVNPLSERRRLGLGVLGLFICVIVGCVVPSQESVRGPGPRQEAPQSDGMENSPADQGLIKPVIPPETPPAPQPSRFEPGPIEPPTVVTPPRKPDEQAAQPGAGPPPIIGQEPSKPPQQSSKPRIGVAPSRLLGESRPREWEDQKIRQMALELAAKSPDIKKARICYAVKENEWWIILYEDVGAFYELKQYIWDKDQDKLEPFLVLKKVPKSRFEEHIKQPDPNRACEMLTLPEANK